MIDPTMFDNLKVVLEGIIYDFEMDDRLTILDRTDSIDLAKLNKSYIIDFKRLRGKTSVTLSMTSDLHTLATELLEEDMTDLACQFQLTFHTPIKNPKTDCEALLFIINKHWRQFHPTITQRISYIYPGHHHYSNAIQLKFEDGLTEAEIDDLHSLMTIIVETLNSIDLIFK
ncbi:hypothetical protein GMB86_11200 [Terrilactibacillus sp. BCM23-1]|uniref:Group-specific protein n=1 Tax=Terrilactibacillus tamarindi TaxID=2599694 RepID=A0A6N8CQY5_9BACI|nr:hypothetical protein [Terrilactibacillus tamarindi]MTT32574.1 hypothetical protein [Terrilactibacillus tamarindi]